MFKCNTTGAMFGGWLKVPQLLTTVINDAPGFGCIVYPKK
jgi:hypothetical protein